MLSASFGSSGVCIISMRESDVALWWVTPKQSKALALERLSRSKQKQPTFFDTRIFANTG